MNIKEAKEQIKNAMTVYFAKDENGDYEIPIEKQRPVFLMGPPGIGKTAIMEQIASELNVGLVSYSMTHHTRQSALGLPQIVQKNYGGVECSISEYTMSEIIASVYDTMEKTGVREGILFLDEINCVSETLAPVMLQFLQYKIFGRHEVPKGWIVVTAGNPPEYNKSVREFDMVTWDRLKRIDCKEDFDAWKEYAYAKSVHPSIMTYLETKKDNFYKVENSVDGKKIVTARGWDDLSTMIRIYEKKGIAVDVKLISQYLQIERIARDFANYYDLFLKYRGDYQVDKILAGKADKSILERAKKAEFGEKLSLLGLIIDAISGKIKESINTKSLNKMLVVYLKSIKEKIAANKRDVSEHISEQINVIEKRIESGRIASSVSSEEISLLKKAITVLDGYRRTVADKPDNRTAFEAINDEFKKRVEDMKKLIEKTGKELSNVYKFCEEAFGGDSQEVLILTTELTINKHCAEFITGNGCQEYFNHNKNLLFYERQEALKRDIDLMGL